MAVDADLLSLMPHKVKVEAVSTRSAYNIPTYAAPATYQALVEHKQRLVRTREGEEKVAGGAIYFGQVVALSPDARVTLPDGRIVVVMATETYSDGRSDHHTVVWFG